MKMAECSPKCVEKKIEKKRGKIACYEHFLPLPGDKHDHIIPSQYIISIMTRSFPKKKVVDDKK